MKTWMKRIVGLVLSLALAVTMIPVTTAHAATEKMTMYVGEQITLSLYGADVVTSVKSGKSSVLKVAKDKEYKYRVIMTGLKAASKPVKVTIKYKYEDYYGKTHTKTQVYSVTVKKSSVTAKLTPLSEGKLLLTLTNKSKQTFDEVLTAYQLQDADGEVVVEDTIETSYVPAGKTVYDTITYDNYSYDVDASKSIAMVAGVGHQPGAKYGNTKLNISYEDEMTVNDYGTSIAEITVKYKNEYKDYVQGWVFVFIYDTDQNLVDVKTHMIFLKGKALETETFNIYDYDENYGGCEVKYATFYKTY